ncbi:MAG: hypothetical protein WKG06_16520 [Segetibacter sp.]
MLTYKRLLVFVYVFTFFTGKARETSSVNPLLVHSNQGVPFDKVNASTIRQAVTTVIKLSDERVKKNHLGSRKRPYAVKYFDGF